MRGARAVLAAACLSAASGALAQGAAAKADPHAGHAAAASGSPARADAAKADPRAGHAEHAGRHADHAAHAAAAPAFGTGELARVRLHDAMVTDHTGRSMHFASEVVGDRLVAITLFYASCKTVCPITNAIFAQVQTRLGERMGREVRLLSLTVDPARDTPPRLAQRAKAHHSGEGWLWITGEKRNLDKVLDGLNAYTADYTQHPIMVLVGDPASGRWHRLLGFPDPDVIVERLDALRAERLRAGLDRSQ